MASIGKNGYKKNQIQYEEYRIGRARSYRWSKQKRTIIKFNAVKNYHNNIHRISTMSTSNNGMEIDIFTNNGNEFMVQITYEQESENEPIDRFSDIFARIEYWDKSNAIKLIFENQMETPHIDGTTYTFKYCFDFDLEFDSQLN